MVLLSRLWHTSYVDYPGNVPRCFLLVVCPLRHSFNGWHNFNRWTLIKILLGPPSCRVWDRLSSRSNDTLESLSHIWVRERILAPALVGEFTL